MAEVDRIRHDDKDIIRGLREGTTEGFVAFYEAYAEKLAGFVGRCLHDPAAAADITHDALIIVRAHIADLRDDDRFAAWVYAIVRNQIRAHVRQGMRVIVTSDIPEETDEPDFEGEADRRDMARVLKESVAGLTDREHCIYELAVIRGLPAEQVADALGISVVNARKLIQRVRMRIARSMGALLVVRHGCTSCPELQAMLTGWDGRFSPLWRKRIARHVDVCTGCDQHRESVMSTPAAVSAKMSAKKVSEKTPVISLSL